MSAERNAAAVEIPKPLDPRQGSRPNFVVSEEGYRVMAEKGVVWAGSRMISATSYGRGVEFVHVGRAGESGTR